MKSIWTLLVFVGVVLIFSLQSGCQDEEKAVQSEQILPIVSPETVEVVIAEETQTQKPADGYLRALYSVLTLS